MQLKFDVGGDNVNKYITMRRLGNILSRIVFLMCLYFHAVIPPGNTD